MERKVKWLTRAMWAFLLLLLLVTAIFFMMGYIEGDFEDVETLSKYLENFGILGPLFLTIIQAMQVILPVLPGWFGSIVGADLFGCWIGFLCNYIGISAGSIIAYYLARKFGMAIVSRMIKEKKFKQLVDWVNTKRSYDWLLFFSILLPLAPDDFLCYFSGLIDMKPKKYVWIIILAKPWCLLAYSIFFTYFI